MSVDPESAILRLPVMFFSLFCSYFLGLGSIILNSLFYVTGKCHRFLHRG